MINKRQENMISDLEKSENPITAKALANKYNVSLRTVRSDVQKITEYLDGKEASFIKIPGVGMRIQSAKSIHSEIIVSKDIQDFGLYSGEARRYAIIFFFLRKTPPIQADYLAGKLGLSKGTIMSEIKKINVELREYNLEIIGKRNKGYYLEGKPIHILAYANNLAGKIYHDKSYYHLLVNDNSIFINRWERDALYELIKFISATFGVEIAEKRKFYLSLMFFLKRASKGEIISINRNLIELLSLKPYKKYMDKLKLEVDRLFNINLNSSQLLYIMYITEVNVKQPADGSDMLISNNTDEIILDLVNEIVKQLPAIRPYYNDIFDDLKTHVRILIYHYVFQIPPQNPLLSQILSKYGNIYQITKEILKNTLLCSYIQISDEETGYFTLYICKYLQMVQEHEKLRILVVCNTGRGVSKLLLSRLENNLPEAEITGLASLFEIENNEEVLTGIDLIVTTIPIKNCKTPSIHVNSIISDKELINIRSVLQLSKGPVTVNEPEINIKGLSSEVYAELAMEMFSLFKELYNEPKKLGENMDSLAGITAHVLMAFPRWVSGSYVVIGESDYNFYKNSYKREFELIGNSLRKIESRFNIFIDPIEIIAIMRYII